MSSPLTRVLPHNLDAEASVLGGILLRNEVLSTLDKLEVEDFYDPRHQAIFTAMQVLEASTRAIDEVTLEAQLQQMGKLEAVGGLAYLSQLGLRVPTADNVVHYAGIVQELNAARRLMLTASEIAARGYEDYGEIEDYLDEAEAKIFEVTQRTQRGNAEHLKNLLKQVFSSLDQRFRAPGGITGVPSGFRDLDEKTAGFQPTELTILAARPAMGKTSLAMSIARNCATSHGFPVLVFSLEMSSGQLAERLLCAEAKIDSIGLRRGQLQRQDLTNMTYAADALSKAPIVIDDTGALTLRELRASARRFMSDKEMKKDKQFGLIIIDYLQLMSGRRDRGSSREQEISEISRGLKAMAKELHCPIMALSQLNRGLESRENKRPQLSDLRECVTGDTRVLLADGQRIPIRDLVGQTPRVFAMTRNERIATADSDRVWPVGLRPVFDVALKSGRRLRATAKHRLYTASGWRRVADLAAGDRLAIARCLPDNTNVDTLPNEVFGRVKATMKARGIPQRQMATLRGTSYGGSSHFAFAPSRELVSEYAELLDDEALRAAAANDLFWDEVLSIEPAGEEEVYDLTVPGPASWLADGIVSHNSGAIEQDADLILFIYRDEVYNKETEEKNIAEIIIGKNRHGPIDTIKTRFDGRYTRFENLSHREPGDY